MPRSVNGLLKNLIVILCLCSSIYHGFAAETITANNQTSPSDELWWLWPAILFLFTIAVGIIAVVAGVGGAVIFVPVVSSIFPFHIDFIRGAGLLVALAGALYASPSLLRNGLADLRLGLPMALISSTSAIFGAMIGLTLPTKYVQIGLGITILFIVFLMTKAKTTGFPVVDKEGVLSRYLKISGTYFEESMGREIPWKIHQTTLGLVLFIFVGFLAGLFGLGAGFANVPVLNLVLGAPLKVCVGTSKFILSITDTSAAWVYINSGAIVPLITVPSVVGMIIGTRIGIKILVKAQPEKIKLWVIMLLAFAGVVSLAKGIILE